MEDSAFDYPHPEINREVNAIGGHYVILKEVRLPYEGREILYVMGTAMVDKTCCGFSGCGFATVPGYIRQWKYKTNAEGRPVSRVAPVTKEAERRQLKQVIEKKEMVSQVNF